MVPQKHTDSGVRPDTLTIPELEQSKAAVLNTLASVDLIGKGRRLRTVRVPSWSKQLLDARLSTFRSERGTSIQKSFEIGKAPRGWRDRERSLVRSQAMRPAGRPSQSGTP
jgi:hypothetical protein